MHCFHAAISNQLPEKPKVCLVLYGPLTQVSLYSFTSIYIKHLGIGFSACEMLKLLLLLKASKSIYNCL